MLGQYLRNLIRSTVETNMAAQTVPLRELGAALPGKPDQISKRQQCILLIEDNEDAIRWLLSVVTKYGHCKYKLEWAGCLSDGLSRLLDGGIDLVVLDLGLPDCSSLFSYGWVREAAPEVPIVVLTADMDDETDFAAVASGMSRYLVKGQASGKTVVDAIKEALGGS
jgi:DNA-binding response OmpR family regulator